MRPCGVLPAPGTGPDAMLVSAACAACRRSNRNAERNMSYFLDQLAFFRREKTEFAGGHGMTTNQSRRWEDAYRQRWQHDKVVRSTHGVNCTGSCSWKIYVKNGLV